MTSTQIQELKDFFNKVEPPDEPYFEIWVKWIKFHLRKADEGSIEHLNRLNQLKKCYEK